MNGPRFPEDDLPRLRIAGRIAADFLLDVARIASAGRSLTDTLILIGIVQANLAPVMSDVSLQRTYAAADHPPPRSLRRPISVNAVAASLKLPFETVRRRVRRLADSGLCELAPSGVVVPEPPLTSPEHRQLLHENFLAVRQLYLDLRRAGCLPALAAAEVDLGPDPPIRAIARLSSEYALRMVEPIASYVGDLTDGFLLMAVVTLNTSHLPRSVREALALEANGFVPDELRRPAPIGAIAARVNLPYELVRRRLRKLARDGRCEVSAAGVMLPASYLARAGMAEFMSRNQANLQRLFMGAAQLGVTSAWERELADGAGGPAR